MFIRATKQILNPFAITLVGAYALAAAAGNFLNRMPEIPGTYYQQARRMADFADHSGVIARATREGRRVVLALGQSRFEASIDPEFLDRALNADETASNRFESYNLGVRFAYLDHLQLLLREVKSAMKGVGSPDTLVIELSPAMLTYAFERSFGAYTMTSSLLPLMLRNAHQWIDAAGLSLIRTASIMAIDQATLEQISGSGTTRMVFGLWKRTPGDTELYWDPALRGGTPYLSRYPDIPQDESWWRINDHHYPVLERTLDISEVKLDPLMVDRLEALLREAASMARQVIFVHSPLPRTYALRRTAMGQARVDDLLARLARIPGVKVADLTREFEDDRNFIDIFHLNREASRKFNLKVAELILGHSSLDHSSLDR